MKDKFINTRDKIKTVSGKVFAFFHRIFLKLENAVLNFFRKILSKIRRVKDFIFSDPKRKIAFIAFLPLTAVLTAGGYFLFRKHYSIHSSVRSGLYTVPKDAAFYAEIRDIGLLKNVVAGSQTFKNVESSEAWARFLTSFAGRKFGELLYLIEVKSNSILEWKDFLDLFTGSIGYISFKDGTYTVVAKTNMKSRFGIGIFESFKSANLPLRKIKKKEIQPPAVPEAKTAENPEPVQPEEEAGDSENPPSSDTSIVSGDSYENSYLEEGIKEGNLIISVVPGNAGDIYFILVGEYLFISDSINSLIQTLQAASNPSKKSILSDKETDFLKQEYYKEENLGLIVLNLEDTVYTPFLRPITENSRSVSLLFKMESGLLTADVFAAGRKALINSVVSSEIPSIIPRDVLLTVYSNSVSVKDYIQSFKNPGESWPSVKEAVDAFFQKGNLKPDEYFTGNSPGVLILHGLSRQEESGILYPGFTIGYVSGKADDVFLKTIFKAGKPYGVNYLDARIKAYKKDGNYYTPAFFQRDKLNWISSFLEDAEQHIATKNGNSPALNDLTSFKALDKAPHHIVLNWKKLEENIDLLMLYGGMKTGKYTDKTVSSDIRPLYEAFGWIESVHLALGLEGKYFGKMIIGTITSGQ